MKKRFEGIDSEEVRKLADEKRRLEEGAQLKAGEVEKVVEARVKALKGDFDMQLSAAKSVGPLGHVSGFWIWLLLVRQSVREI